MKFYTMNGKQEFFLWEVYRERSTAQETGKRFKKTMKPLGVKDCWYRTVVLEDGTSALYISPWFYELPRIGVKNFVASNIEALKNNKSKRKNLPLNKGTLKKYTFKKGGIL